jgi:hypothetical protein
MAAAVRAQKRAPGPSFIEFLGQLGVHLEPGQAVFWAVAADGVHPCDLPSEQRELAATIFGADVERVPAGARHVVALIKGAESGFSFIVGLRLLHRALFASVTEAAKGEIRPALCIAPDLRAGRIPVRVAREAAESDARIRSMIERATADGFVLDRGDGKRTSVECLPATNGGRASRGRRYVEVVLDEASLFRDESGAVSDKDVFQSVVTRCKGTTWLGSTPWLPSNVIWRLYQENYGAPVDCLAAKLPTTIARSDPRVLRQVAKVEALDPHAAAVEFHCELPNSAATFFDQAALDLAFDDDVSGVSTSERGSTVAAAIDLGLRRDASACTILRVENGTLVPAEVVEIKPQKGQPLKPSAVCERFAAVCKRHGVTQVTADQHYLESLREHLGAHGISVREAPSGAGGKLETYEAVRGMLNEGRLRFGREHRTLVDQLRAIIGVPVSGGGILIRQPRRSRHGGHCDSASAYVLAAHALARFVRVRRQHPYRRAKTPAATDGEVTFEVTPEGKVIARRRSPSWRQLGGGDGAYTFRNGVKGF